MTPSIPGRDGRLAGLAALAVATATCTVLGWRAAVDGRLRAHAR